MVLDDILCHDLGMERGVTKDFTITASGVYDYRFLAEYARLNWKSSWIPREGTISVSWLQITFKKMVILRGAATQGRYNNPNEVILTYKLSYSKDRVGNLNVYKEQGIEKVSFLSERTSLF